MTMSKSNDGRGGGGGERSKTVVEMFRVMDKKMVDVQEVLKLSKREIYRSLVLPNINIDSAVDRLLHRGNVGGKNEATPIATKKKVVSTLTSMKGRFQRLQELVGLPKEEIMTALVDCGNGIDPDEAAIRLLSQDTFQEVIRKRNRKKAKDEAKSRTADEQKQIIPSDSSPNVVGSDDNQTVVSPATPQPSLKVCRRKVPQPPPRKIYASYRDAVGNGLKLYLDRQSKDNILPSESREQQPIEHDSEDQKQNVLPPEPKERESEDQREEIDKSEGEVAMYTEDLLNWVNELIDDPPNTTDLLQYDMEKPPSSSSTNLKILDNWGVLSLPSNLNKLGIWDFCIDEALKKEMETARRRISFGSFGPATSESESTSKPLGSGVRNTRSDEDTNNIPETTPVRRDGGRISITSLPPPSNATSLSGTTAATVITPNPVAPLRQNNPTLNAVTTSLESAYGHRPIYLFDCLPPEVYTTAASTLRVTTRVENPSQVNSPRPSVQQVTVLSTNVNPTGPELNQYNCPAHRIELGLGYSYYSVFPRSYLSSIALSSRRIPQPQQPPSAYDGQSLLLELNQIYSNLVLDSSFSQVGSSNNLQDPPPIPGLGNYSQHSLNMQPPNLPLDQQQNLGGYVTRPFQQSSNLQSPGFPQNQQMDGYDWSTSFLGFYPSNQRFK